jgi:hypothetical protein
MEMSGQLHAPARPLHPQGKSPWYPLDRRLGRPQSRSGHGGEKKNSQPLPGLEPPIVQPLAQHYTTELSRLRKLWSTWWNWMFLTRCHWVLYYEGVSKCFRTGRLARELQMVQLSATTCSCIAISWISLVSCAAITLWRGQQWVIPKVSVHFVIESVRKLLDTPSYDLRRREDRSKKGKILEQYVTVWSHFASLYRKADLFYRRNGQQRREERFWHSWQGSLDASGASYNLLFSNRKTLTIRMCILLNRMGTHSCLELKDRSQMCSTDNLTMEWRYFNNMHISL